ncbi:MAG: hypothetical protein AVDCRST_MAG08-3388, partial [uncultured Acetobacteraceae bacterium]
AAHPFLAAARRRLGRENRDVPGRGRSRCRGGRFITGAPQCPGKLHLDHDLRPHRAGL